MPRRLSAPLESWLACDDHRRAAAAAVRCRHGGAFCMTDGFCHYEGACFGLTPQERVEAEIADLCDALRSRRCEMEAGLESLSFWLERRALLALLKNP